MPPAAVTRRTPRKGWGLMGDWSCTPNLCGPERFGWVESFHGDCTSRGRDRVLFPGASLAQSSSHPRTLSIFAPGVIHPRETRARFLRPPVSRVWVTFSVDAVRLKPTLFMGGRRVLLPSFAFYAHFDFPEKVPKLSLIRVPQGTKSGTRQSPRSVP